MNRKSFGFKIEAGPNISQNPDMGANIGDATRQPNSPSRLTRTRIAAGLLAASLAPLSEKQIQATLDEENRLKVVRSEMDEATGAITELYGDGRRVSVESYHHAEMPEASASIPVTPLEVPPNAK